MGRVAALCMGLLAAGCAAAPPRDLAVGQEVALEVESFRLQEAQPAAREGAGGGRVVLFGSEKSRAEGSLHLAAGAYEVTLILDGPDAEHDAVFIEVAESEHRLHPDGGYRGCLSPATIRPEFCIGAAGAVPIVLRAAETGVSLDRVIVRRIQ